jgi:hypothetical protein
MKKLNILCSSPEFLTKLRNEFPDSTEDELPDQRTIFHLDVDPAEEHIVCGRIRDLLIASTLSYTIKGWGPLMMQRTDVQVILADRPITHVAPGIVPGRSE